MNQKKYDSRKDTQIHINRVRQLIAEQRINLLKRGGAHDESKLRDPERSIFDEWRPKLDEHAYGTPEYMNAVASMGPAIDHHYKCNSHHPEHYENGVGGMTLLDLLEMLADWKAASERREDGSMAQSLGFGVGRFEIDTVLAKILTRTAEELGWL